MKIWDLLQDIFGSPEFISSSLTIVEIIIFPYFAIETSTIEKLFLWLLQYIALKAILRINKTLNYLKNTAANRTQLDELKKIVAKDRPFLFKRTTEPLAEVLSAAKKTIICSGTTLQSICHMHRNLLEEKFEEGCSIRLLLIDPSQIKNTAKMVNWSQESIRNDLSNSIIALSPFIGKKSEKGGVLEARLMPAFPGFCLLSIDPEEPHAKIKVELQSNNAQPSSRANFFVEKEGQSEWFQLFISHFNNIWKISDPLTPEKVSSINKAK